jgi:hypothetical protein
MIKFDIRRKDSVSSGLLIGFLAMMLIISPAFGGGPAPVTKFHYPKIVIESPSNNATVPASIEVNGTIVGDIPFDWHMWVLVNPRSAPGQWWPQGGGEIEPWNGTWYTQALIGGGDADIGKRFEIRAVLVDNRDNNYLNKWILETNKIGDWPSIPLPASSVGNASTVVIRSN